MDKEYLQFLVKSVVEDKFIFYSMKLNRIRNTLLALALLLGLFSFIGIKYAINYNITPYVNNAVKSNIAKFSKNYDERLLYISAISDLATINYASEVSEKELNDIIDKIYALYISYSEISGFDTEILIYRLSDFLMRSGDSKLMQQVSEMFSKVILSSTRTTAIFVNYYGEKVLGINGNENGFLEEYYSKFNYYIENDKKLGNNSSTLPILAVVSFHVTGQMRSSNSNQLIQYVSNLPVEDKANFLMGLVVNTNRSSFQINDYTIVQTTENFISSYKNELEQIIYSNGVKEYIIDKYKNSYSNREIGKYRYILNYLYKMDL